MNAYPDNPAGRLTPGGRPGHPSAAMRRPHKSRKVTIADVAERAGVSKTTVSHVLSRNRPVASGTSARVELAVAELGYRPDGLRVGGIIGSLPPWRPEERVQREES